MGLNFESSINFKSSFGNFAKFSITNKTSTSFEIDLTALILILFLENTFLIEKYNLQYLFDVHDY